MNTTVYATAWCRLRLVTALLGALALVAGCATTRPARYFVSPGGIGVAVISAPQAEIATVRNAVREGAIEGLVPAFSGGPQALILGLFIAPFTAAYGATQGTACQQQIDAAYPRLSEKYAGIVQREISLTNVQNQFVAGLRKVTAAPIVEIGAPHRRDDADHRQQLLAAAAQRVLDHVFVIKVRNISIGADLKGHCDSWTVSVDMAIELWTVADRRLVFDRPLGYGPVSVPFVKGQWSELKSILDEPGAFQARLVPVFEAAGTNLVYESRFLLPP